jgi:hypothetical protein
MRSTLLDLLSNLLRVRHAGLPQCVSPTLPLVVYLYASTNQLTASSVEHPDIDVVAINDPFIDPNYAVCYAPTHSFTLPD